MEVITHKCPNCDGALTFDPTDQKFHCPYCLSVFSEAEVSDFEASQKAARLVEEKTVSPDLNEANQSNQSEAATATKVSQEAEMDLFICPSCGAEIVTDKTTAATYCYFCHNPVVLSGRLSGAFLPDKVLPFAIEKEEATKQFLAWVQKKWFIPKNFFNEEQIEKLTGVYFPYWVVDAKGDGEISGTGTSIRIWRVGDIEYTETKQYAVFRKGTLQFRELVKNALSKNIQQQMVEGVQPFPLEKAKEFKSQYLAGFQAEKRDIEYQSIRPDITQELEGYGETLLRNSVSGYTSFSAKQRSLQLTEDANHYMLLPVWLVTYRSKQDSKKTYYYAMNGQTGKISGVLPISYPRLGWTTAGVFALFAIIFMIVGYFV